MLVLFIVTLTLLALSYVAIFQESNSVTWQWSDRYVWYPTRNEASVEKGNLKRSKAFSTLKMMLSVLFFSGIFLVVHLLSHQWMTKTTRLKHCTAAPAAIRIVVRQCYKLLGFKWPDQTWPDEVKPPFVSISFKSPTLIVVFTVLASVHVRDTMVELLRPNVAVEIFVSG